MSLQTIIRALIQRLARQTNLHRRRRQDFRALSHLDAHLLRDIGLRVEEGHIVPISPVATEARRVEQTGAAVPTPEAETQGRGGVKTCRHCGAALA